MVKTILLFISSFIVISSVAQYPTNGLMGYYPLNGNANDLSGNGFNGTLAGQIVVPGICSDGYLFSNNYIDCGDPVGNEFDLTGDATISMWVKLSVIPSSYFTLTGKDVGPGNYNHKWFFAIHANSLSMHINGPGMGGGSGYWTFSSNYSFSLNTFYHVVITKSGDFNYQFFINAVPSGTGTLPQNIIDVPFNLRIGKNETSNMEGTIDEVFIYNRVLTLPEINQLYRQVFVSVTASANPFCAGKTTIFTAIPSNEGISPFYQWKVNGLDYGSNSSTLSYVPSSGDMIACTLTSSDFYLCNPSSSNTITMVSLPSSVVSFATCFDTVTTINAKPIKLKGGLPLGGTYSGPGVDPLSGLFTPSLAGTGTKTITYSYTNVSQCSSFKTKTITVQSATNFNCGNDFTDIRDNTVYPTVQIGLQCWMATNLNYGNRIPGSEPQLDNCIPEKYCFNDLTTNCQLGTAVYQWDELMEYDDIPGIKGFCPPNWHVPTEADWNTLFAVYVIKGLDGSPLKYSGSSGFNALPGGVSYLNHQWDFHDFATLFWSSTADGGYRALAHGLNTYNPSVSLYSSSRANAFSLRCLKDSCSAYPNAPTAGIHVPSTTQIIWNWNTVAGATGYKWNYSNDFATAIDMGLTTTKTEICLTCNTAYSRYVWAYSQCGISAPVNLNQTTLVCTTQVVPCEGTPTVTYNGQLYNTVQIGTQCWFKENLNTGTRVNGSVVQTNNNVVEKYCYNDLELNCDIYGGLYQWHEMMQYVTTTGAQGICPTDWHIPAQAEWITLMTLLGGEYTAGGKMKEICTAHWNPPNTDATNESGFTALGGGYSDYYGFFYGYGIHGYWWNSSESGSMYNYAWECHVFYNMGFMANADSKKDAGYSVRCLRNY